MRTVLGADKQALLRRKIGELAREPLALSEDIRKLQGRSEYRLRVQDWRIIFRIEENILWIDDISRRGSY